MPYRVLKLLLPSLWLVLAAFAPAQGLTGLARPDAYLAIGFRSGDAGWSQLREDLSSIDWHALRSTLDAALLAADPGGGDSPLAEFDALFAGDPVADLLSEACPELAAAMESLAEGEPSGFDGLLTVGGDALPDRATLFLRLEGLTASAGETVGTALAACSDGTAAGDIGSDLLVFGEAGDSVFVSFEDGLLVVGSDEAAVRGALERAANGGPSLADGALMAAFPELPEDAASLTMALLIEPHMDTLTTFLPLFLPGGPSQQPLVDRLVAAIDTVEGVAFRFTFGADGLVTETALELDPDSPDPELAALLACGECRPLEPSLAPADAVGFSSFHLPVTALVEYLDGWLTAAEAGFTVSQMLPAGGLSFLGDRAYTILLEPLDTDLRTLMFQPGQALVIPVSSSADALAALDWLRTELNGRLSSDEQLRRTLAVGEGQYEGVRYLRLRATLSIDVAVAVLGENLVLASPAVALERLVETYRGGERFTDGDAYRELLAAVPGDAVGVSSMDASSMLEGLAALADLFAQPLAFVAGYAGAGDEDDAFDSDWGAFDLGPSPDFTGAAMVSVKPGAVNGALEERDAVVDGKIADLFLLEGIAAGDTVTIVVESGLFDTYLSLHDLETGTIVDRNDDAPDVSRSEISFEAAEGARYLVQVTSYFGDETGEYALAIEAVQPVPAPPMPSYAELLDLFGLPGRLLHILADNFGASQGYTLFDGDVLYSRNATPLR